MKNKLFIFSIIFILLFSSCSNITQNNLDIKSENDNTNGLGVKITGTTEVKMFFPDYYLLAESCNNKDNARVISPQTDSVRLSYMEEGNWFEINTIPLLSAKKEDIEGVPVNFPGKVYTFTFDGLELGDYVAGELKVELLNADGIVITSGESSNSVTVSKNKEESVAFYTLPELINNGDKGSLKAGEMKFVPISVVKDFDYSFRIKTNGDYPDVALFSPKGQFEKYFPVDDSSNANVTFKASETGINYLGVWADDGNGISDYSINFDSKSGTVLNNAVLSGEELHWTKEKSPYYMTKNTLVDENSVLTIDAGVQLIVKGPYYLKITGVVNAKGTKEEPVLFMKSINDISPWEGIQINSSTELVTSNDYNYQSGIIFDNCIFTGANIPLKAESSVYLKDCIFTGNESEVNIYNYNSVIMGSTIDDGIITENWGSSLLLVNNKISKNCAVNGIINNNDFRNCKIQLNDCSNNRHYINNNFYNCNFSNFQSQNTLFNGNNFYDCKSPIFSTYSDYSPNSYYDVRDNYWGTENTNELKESLHSKNKNMSFIVDYNDDFNLMRFDYSGWSETPVDKCGYLGDKLILFDYTINSHNFNGDSSFNETKDTNLSIGLVQKFNKNKIVLVRYAQSVEELNQATWNTYNSEFIYSIDTAKIVNGEAEIFVQLQDELGNCSSFVKHSIPFDNPVVNIDLKENQTFNNNMQFNVSVTDKGGYSRINIYIDDVICDYSEISSDSNKIKYELPIKYLADGEHKLRVEVFDCAGNKNEKSVPFAVKKSSGTLQDNASFNSSTGEFINDSSTAYLWHFNGIGKAEGNTAEMTGYQAGTGGLGGNYSESTYYNNFPLSLSDNCFTLEFWSYGNNYNISVDKTNCFDLSLCYSNNSIHVYDKNNENKYLYVKKTRKQDNTWHYWAYVYDGTSIIVYCDGVPVDYIDELSFSINNNNNDVQIHIDNGDELRISTSVRTPDEIGAYYKAAKTVLSK